MYIYRGLFWEGLDVQNSKVGCPGRFRTPGSRVLAGRRKLPGIFGRWPRAWTFWTAGKKPLHETADLQRVWTSLGGQELAGSELEACTINGVWWTWMGGKTCAWNAQSGPILTGGRPAADLVRKSPKKWSKNDQNWTGQTPGQTGLHRVGSGSCESWSTRLEVEEGVTSR